MLMQIHMHPCGIELRLLLNAYELRACKSSGLERPDVITRTGTRWIWIQAIMHSAFLFEQLAHLAGTGVVSSLQ